MLMLIDNKPPKIDRVVYAKSATLLKPAQDIHNHSRINTTNRPHRCHLEKRRSMHHACAHIVLYQLQVLCRYKCTVYNTTKPVR